MLKSNLKTIFGIVYVITFMFFLGFLAFSHPNCTNIEIIAKYCKNKQPFVWKQSNALAIVM